MSSARVQSVGLSLLLVAMGDDQDMVRHRAADLLRGLSVDEVGRVAVYVAHRAARREDRDGMAWASRLVEDRRRVDEVDALEASWREPGP